jgi:hypothetical protein
MKPLILLLTLITALNAQTFQSLYTKNKKEGIGNYITIDFLLNNLYLHKKEIITEIERKQLEPNLKKFSYRLIRETIKKRVTDNRLLVYLATLNMLQNSALPKLPTHIIYQAKEELNRIDRASLKGYRKFKNSGRLKDRNGYFKALTFVTKVPFFINPSKMTSTDINISNTNIKRGLVLADIISSDEKLKSLYMNIDSSLKALFGEADDLGVVDFFEFRLNSSVQSVKKRLDCKANYPKIIGEQVDITGVKRKDIAKNLLSFRLFSSRYSLDSYLFSRVVFPYVLAPLHGKKDKYCSVVNGRLVRTLPSIRDIELLFNSPKKETYINYFKNLKLVQKDLKYLNHPKSLYSYDFKIYKELLKVKKKEAFKGYYTQNRYLMYAYLKKSHTPTQRSMVLGATRDRAELEKDIGTVLELMIDELNFLSKIYPNPKSENLMKLFKELKRISKVKKYSKKEIEFLNSVDVGLKNIVKDSFKPISVELHRDGNSRRALVEGLKNPKIIEKDGLRGVKYEHNEYFVR